MSMPIEQKISFPATQHSPFSLPLLSDQADCKEPRRLAQPAERPDGHLGERPAAGCSTIVRQIWEGLKNGRVRRSGGASAGSGFLYGGDHLFGGHRRQGGR